MTRRVDSVEKKVLQCQLAMKNMDSHIWTTLVKELLCIHSLPPQRLRHPIFTLSPVDQDGRTSWRDVATTSGWRSSSIPEIHLKIPQILTSVPFARYTPCGNGVMIPLRLQWHQQRHAWQYWGMDGTAVIVQEKRSGPSVPCVVDRRPLPTFFYTAQPCNKPDPPLPTR